MNLTFYGAAGKVTGSKHLLEINQQRILLDCGFFQGLPDVNERNRSLPFPPESVDAVVLSHAHIDHCGMLPMLVKRGFSGPIYASRATCDVAVLMLKDMAKIQEQDANYRQAHKIGAPDDRVSLFGLKDVDAVGRRMVPVEYQRIKEGWTELSQGLRIKLYDAGHILGSAITVVEAVEGKGVKRVVYTGDIGPRGLPLLFDPQIPGDEAGVLITETTYGSRKHEDLQGSIERLAKAVNKVVARGGKLIVPAFSLGRTQALVYILHKLSDEGRIPQFPIYVDSPLAVNLTEIYLQHRQDYDAETWEDFKHSGKPLDFKGLKYISEAEDSKKLNCSVGPFMVISGSGMMTAGRIVHHLIHGLQEEKNGVFITGYMAEGTTGRQILDGDKWVEVMERRVGVKAEVFLFNEFSAHADRVELQEFAEGIKGLKQMFLVHGEPHQADDFKAQISKAHPEWSVVRPDEGDSFVI